MSSELSGEALDQLTQLASQLVWRVGRLGDDGPLTVRVGFATGTATFAELPRLKNVTDAEVEVAIREGTVRVEWVGSRPS
jgi:methyl coenzyme M reductase subunit D